MKKLVVIFLLLILSFSPAVVHAQLNKTDIDSAEVAKLSAQIDSAKTIVYMQKIEEYKAKLAQDSTNKDAVINLGQYYTNLADYDSAEAVYENYLNKYPDDSEVFYKYAQAEANNREFDKASANMDILLQKDPNNLKYQLFRAQLAVWVGQNYNRAKTYLNNVLAENPNNLAALLAKSSLDMHTNDFVSAQNNMDKIKTIDPENADLKKLESDMYVQKLRYKQEQQFAILLEGERLYGSGNCKEAIAKYDEYMSQTEPNVLIEKEYADVNVCAGNYQKAIDIYNNVLNQGYDYNVDLQRAKTYYYMGDSVNALAAFQRLTKDQPKDFTTNLYLGDSYSRMHEYGKARDVYYNMEDKLELDSSQTAIVNQRISWTPVTGFRGMLASFPTYILLTPYGSYYSDNTSIKENTQGLRIDLGLTSFLSVGVEAFRSTLASGSNSTFNYNVVNSNSIRWNIGLRLSDSFTFGVGFGNSYYGNNVSQPLANIYLRSDVPDVYSAYATYDKLDASQVIYSPSLISLRFNTDLFRLGGSYQFKSGVKLGADYSHFSISDGNQGYNLALRIGKYFYPGFLLGYEYLASGFAKSSFLYYSPSTISSHNITADWDIIKDTTATVTIGGLIGFIANSNTIIRQAYAAATVRLASSFSIQARVLGGGSYQYGAGYNSFSAYLAAYWTL
ncbi:MAG: tetratricopeptide repeat protein [Ignavibacteriaceae bacterium]